MMQRRFDAGQLPTAIQSIISKTYVESVGLPTFLPTFIRRLVTDCLAPNNTPHPFKIPSNRDPTGVPPPYSG